MYTPITREEFFDNIRASTHAWQIINSAQQEIVELTEKNNNYLSLLKQAWETLKKPMPFEQFLDSLQRLSEIETSLNELENK